MTVKEVLIIFGERRPIRFLSLQTTLQSKRRIFMRQLKAPLVI